MFAAFSVVAENLYVKAESYVAPLNLVCSVSVLALHVSLLASAWIIYGIVRMQSVPVCALSLPLIAKVALVQPMGA